MNNKIYNTGQLIFDIDTKEAKKLYSSSYKNIYKKIKNYLTKLVFEHIQSSGYEINVDIDEDLILGIIDDLKQDLLKYNFDLDKVVKEMHIGFIDHSHYLNYLKDIRYSNMKDFHSLAHLFDHSRKLHFSFAIFIIFSHNIII